MQIEEDDYISLTDMVRKIDNGPALIEKWLRNKNTIEFLGIWEEMYNADFNIAACEDIIELLEDVGESSETLKKCTMEQTDMEVLRKWVKTAARAESIEELSRL